MKSGEQGKWKIKPKVKSWKEKTVGVSGQVGGEEGRGGGLHLFVCVVESVLCIDDNYPEYFGFCKDKYTHHTFISVCIYIYIRKRKNTYSV